MSDSSQDNGRQGDDAPGSGILAALPRTRPQRASPRRAAAAKKREAAPERATATTATKKTSAPAKKASKPVAKANAAAAKAKTPITRAKAVRKAVRPVEPSVPKQGYEPEDEVELGTTVNPPSSAELVESVADIFSELAGAGLTAGGRILKDAFSFLRFP